MHNDTDIRFLSDPIDLHWLGWRTDTATLAKFGWDISADQNPVNRTMRIALRKQFNNGMQIQGISELEEFLYVNYQRANNLQIRPQTRIMQMELAHNLHVGYNYVHDADWNAVDANPIYTSQRIESLEDMVHFKKLNQDTKEIILQKASMDDVLKYALDKQLHRQEEIREEMMKRKKMQEYKQNTEVKAELRLVA